MKDTVYIKYDVFGFILTYVNIFAQGLRINQSPMGKKKKDRRPRTNPMEWWYNQLSVGSN